MLVNSTVAPPRAPTSPRTRSEDSAALLVGPGTSSIVAYVPRALAEMPISRVENGTSTAYASTLGTYAGFAAGGVLFHAASVLDGVDGEVARLTFRSSRRGQWLDTIADDASNLVYFAGLTVGVWRASMSPVLWYFGVTTVVVDAVAVGFLYWHLVTHYDAATLLAYQPSLERAATRSTGHWLALKLQFMSRRDSYALLIMCGSLAGLAWVTLVVTPVVIVSVLVAAAFLVREPAAGRG